MTKTAFNKSTSTYTITDEQLVNRFVMLGSVEPRATKGTEPSVITSIVELIKRDGPGTVNHIADILLARRATKNKFGLFALALCVVSGNEETKKAAYKILPEVCNIPTDLFVFIGYYESLNKQLFGKSGWGNGAKRAVSRWYNDRSVADLVFATTKFKQRDGWSHKDVLRLAHPKPASKDHNTLYQFLTKGKLEINETQVDDLKAFERLEATDAIHRVSSVEEVCEIVQKHNLAWEHVPSEYLNKPEVWAHLVQKMPPKALIRNLAKMTAVGLFDLEGGKYLKLVIDHLTDAKRLNSVRLHPFAVLQAKSQYQQGRGDKGSLVWAPHPKIVAALDKAFTLCYGSITPMNKNVMIGLDVSGSMDQKALGNMSARLIASTLATALVRTEPDVKVGAFSSSFLWLDLKKTDTIDDVIQKTQRLPFLSTDCSLPIKKALAENLQVDAFVIITDNENNPGSGNPSALLEQYRKKHGRDTKLVCICVQGSYNTKTIGDPNDPNILEISGFDADTPEIISQFLTGKISERPKPSKINMNIVTGILTDAFAQEQEVDQDVFEEESVG